MMYGSMSSLSPVQAVVLLLRHPRCSFGTLTSSFVPIPWLCFSCNAALIMRLEGRRGTAEDSTDDVRSRAASHDRARYSQSQPERLHVARQTVPEMRSREDDKQNSVGRSPVDCLSRSR